MKKLYISPDLKWNVINAKEDILIGSGEDMDNLCRFVNMKKEILERRNPGLGIRRENIFDRNNLQAEIMKTKAEEILKRSSFCL